MISACFSQMMTMMMHNWPAEHCKANDKFIFIDFTRETSHIKKNHINADMQIMENFLSFSVILHVKMENNVANVFLTIEYCN